jgi:polyribonucleotide nucleotidyltransferase
MKLDQRKIHWIIRQKQKNVTAKQIAFDMKISWRRVQQIWKIYAESKQDLQSAKTWGGPGSSLVSESGVNPSEWTLS